MRSAAVRGKLLESVQKRFDLLAPLIENQGQLHDAPGPASHKLFAGPTPISTHETVSRCVLLLILNYLRRPKYILLKNDRHLRMRWGWAWWWDFMATFRAHKSVRKIRVERPWCFTFSFTVPFAFAWILIDDFPPNLMRFVSRRFAGADQYSTHTMCMQKRRIRICLALGSNK